MVLQLTIGVLRDETGATAIDYGIVVLLLSITAATAFDTFGDYIVSMFSLASAD